MPEIADDLRHSWQGWLDCLQPRWAEQDDSKILQLKIQVREKFCSYDCRLSVQRSASTVHDISVPSKEPAECVQQTGLLKAPHLQLCAQVVVLPGVCRYQGCQTAQFKTCSVRNQ